MGRFLDEEITYSGKFIDEEQKSPIDSIPIVEDSSEEIPYLFSTETLRDEWISKGSIGVGEAFERQDKLDLIPFSPSGVVSSAQVLTAVNRLQEDKYDDQTNKDKDLEIFKNYWLKFEEEQVRGFTYFGNVYRGVSQLPAFMIEFAATGGVAAIGKNLAKKAIGVGAETAVKGLAKKATVAGVGIVGASVARTPFMYNIYTPKYNENQIFSNIALTDIGVGILKDGKESPAISFVKAYGDAFIEVASESMGGELFKPAGKVVSKGIASKLSPATKAGITKFMNFVTSNGKLSRAFNRGGFDGIIEEIGEEVVGDQLRAAFNIEDFGEEDGNIIDRMRAAIPDFDELSVMAGVFAVPGVTSYVGDRLLDKLYKRGVKRQDATNIIDSISESEKRDLLNNFLSEEKELSRNAIEKAFSGKELNRGEEYALLETYKEYVNKGWIKQPVSEEAQPIAIVEKAKAVNAVNEIIENQEVLEVNEEDESIVDSIKSIVSRYDEGDEKISTVRDVVEEVSIQLEDASDSKQKSELQEALDVFEQELEDDFELAGRNDMDSANDNVISAINKYIESSSVPKVKKEPKQTRKQKYDAMVSQVEDIKKKKEELEVERDSTNELIRYLVEERKRYKSRVIRHANDKEAEEYERVPKFFRSNKKSGITLDELAMEIGVDKSSEAIDYLENLDSSIVRARKDLKSISREIQEKQQKKVVKSEIDYLKQRLTDFQAGKYEERNSLDELRMELTKRVRKELPASERGKMITSINNIKDKKTLEAGLERLKEIYEKYYNRLVKAKSIKAILKRYKRPENIIDADYQKKIEDIRDKFGEKKSEKLKTLLEMSADELVSLAREITDLTDKGKALFKKKKEAKTMASEILRGALIKSAGGTIDSLAIGSQEEAERRKGDTDPFIAPLRLIRKIFGKLGENILFDSVDHAENIAQATKIDRLAKINSIFRKAGLSRFILGKLVDFNGQSFSINTLMAFYAQRRNEHARKALIHGNNIPEQTFDKIVNRFEKEYPEYAKAVDEIKQEVGGKYENIRQVMAETFNIVMKQENDYFPMYRQRMDSQDDPESIMGMDLISDMALRNIDGIDYASVQKGFGIERKQIADRNQLPISSDFMGDAIRAIDTQEHFINFAYVQKMYNSLKHDRDLQNAIVYNHGDGYWKSLDKYMNQAINPRIEYRGLSKWERHLREVRKALGVAFLGYNLKTTMKNLVTANLALKYSNIGMVYRSIIRVGMNPKLRQEIIDNDPSLKRVIIDRNIDDIMKQTANLPANDVARALLLAKESIGKDAFQWIINMDMWARLATYDAVYESNKIKLGEKEARKLAHKALLETQAQGGRTNLPEIYRENNELLRIFLLFTNQATQTYNMMRYDLPAEVSRKEYDKAMLGVTSLMISSFLIYLISHGGTPPDDDDNNEWMFDAMFGEIVSSIPVIGNIAMSYSRGYQPAFSPAESVLDSFKYAKKNFENEDYLLAVMDSISSVSILAGVGIPSSQVKTTVKGIRDLYEGDTDDLRRLIYSKSSIFEE